ncbi:nitroreductase family protein [uncultured Dysgonomonas sp.]|uniref:nitroreductase family protein n=1 Tax=Dysgonomonas mossii TaxID=163665 RepID=UPI002804FE6D|nr:nitroreductase family protein [uncultured Dysgonomonas sp.]
MNKKYILFGLITICSITFTSCSQKDEKQITKKEAALSAIYNRKSVRSFIKDRPVSDEDVQALIKAGMSAPSGKDTRPWEFVIINDRAILDKMAEELPTAKMLSQAPMAIVVCGDTIRSSYWYLDCSAATENILLAAEAMELGGVWTAAYPYRDRMATVIKHTNMPAQVLPLAVIPIGYPMGNHSVKDKYDEKKIHMNKW